MAKKKSNYDIFQNGLRLRFYYEGKRYAVLGATQKECEAKKNEKIKELTEHTHIKNSKLTLTDYYQEWDQHRKGKVKDSTRYDNSKKWARIKPILGSCRLQEIDRRQVKAFQTELYAKALNRESTLTSTGVNNTIRLLSMVLESAKCDGIISENPCKGIRPLKRTEPKAYDTIHRALTLEEQNLFFEYATESWYYNLFRFMLCTGCRLGEAGALTWRDIDFKSGSIDINKTIARISDKEFIISDTPKTEDSKRQIPLTEQARAIIEDQRERLQLVNGAINLNGRIFPTVSGGIITPANMGNIIKAILRNVEKETGSRIEYFSSHAFRDTFATRCIESGMTVKTLQTIMGHSDFSVTMNKYAHVLPDTKREELQAVRFMI